MPVQPRRESSEPAWEDSIDRTNRAGVARRPPTASSSSSASVSNPGRRSGLTESFPKTTPESWMSTPVVVVGIAVLVVVLLGLFGVLNGRETLGDLFPGLVGPTPPSSR